jgi:hypothetical protein
MKRVVSFIAAATPQDRRVHADCQNWIVSTAVTASEDC